jgi:hypothetical protein
MTYVFILLFSEHMDLESFKLVWLRPSRKSVLMLLRQKHYSGTAAAWQTCVCCILKRTCFDFPRLSVGSN